ncbi:DUF2515 family protein [Paucisalibacillus sp. EB02]|uniref:DUF2515 family protein n=1 Tax=Paucisalibacillus sp. EB02 TaxID=1347087 RepID=UPI0004B48191|nr:DUF2515 family protein [Paucisalibacillus sp. EB02]
MLNSQKRDYLYYIINKTRKYNIDNISRTKAYQRFFIKYPEIKWAIVASIVSRNAGWNMTDLYLLPYKKMLSDRERNQLFMTYERANWLIFSDAFPQLLIYELSLKNDLVMFDLLDDLHVSSFMKREWQIFSKTKDKNRLLTALIINEQNVIQRPVISQPYFRKKVFLSFPYVLQNNLMLNAVLLPTTTGRLYGSYIHGFTNVTNRITLGKKIARQLFHPDIYPNLMDFMLQVEHTGSRYDYEQLLPVDFPKSPMLRTVYPIIDHQDNIRIDWFKYGGIKKKWFFPEQSEVEDIGKSFYQKRNLLYAYYHVKNIFN